MIIVCEGPDNAGKTTLASSLAKELKGVYLKTEMVPAKNEYLEKFTRVLEAASQYSDFVVCDRHHTISEPIYGEIIRGGHDLDSEDAAEAMQAIDLIIYCRPPTPEILGTLGDRGQMEGVIENTRTIIDSYDLLMNELVEIPIFTFDYTRDSINQLVLRIRALAVAFNLNEPSQ